MLRVGTLQLFEGRAGRSASDLIHGNIETIRYADELGFHSAWVGEHHLGEYGMCGSPALVLSSAALVTRRIRLGAGVVLLPLHHPVRVAEDYAMLDVLSHGRVDLGVGRGWQPSEFAGYGVDQARSSEMFDEGVEIIRKAWRNRSIDYEGNHYSLQGVDIQPKPTQCPHPPIWMAAVSQSSFERAGRLGLHVLCSPIFGDSIEALEPLVARYRAARVAVGLNAADTRVGLMCIVSVAHTTAIARDLIEGPATWQFDRLFGYRQRGSRGTAASGFETYARFRDQALSVNFDQLVDRGAVVYGDAQTVSARLVDICGRLGVTDLLCWTRLGGLADHLVRETKARISNDVMPRIGAA